jgi:hypothetical protein
MKIKVEKETKWKENEVKTTYYIWVDDRCTAIAESEDQAFEIVKKIEGSKEKLGSTIIYENEI